MFLNRLTKFYSNSYNLLTVNSLIVFFEFQLGSYGKSLGPNLFIFSRLIIFFEIYPSIQFLFKIICGFGDMKV